MCCVTQESGFAVEVVGPVALVRWESRAPRTAGAAKAAAALLRRLVDEGGLRRLVVNLAGAPYVGSDLLVQFFLVHRRLRQAGGRLALCGVRRALAPALESTGLVALFEVHPGERAALAALDPDGAARHVGAAREEAEEALTAGSPG